MTISRVGQILGYIPTGETDFHSLYLVFNTHNDKFQSVYTKHDAIILYRNEYHRVLNRTKITFLIEDSDDPYENNIQWIIFK